MMVAVGLSLPASTKAQTGDSAEATQKLFEAVRANDYEAAQASVAAGADVDAPDRWGMTPAELAIDKGYYQIAHYLVAVRKFKRDKDQAKKERQAISRSVMDRMPGSGNPDNVGAPRSAEGKPTRNPQEPLVASPSIGGDVTGLSTSSGADDQPAWPSGKPNPFDPNVPAPGSGRFAVGEVGTAGGKSFSRFSEEASEPSLAEQWPDSSGDGAAEMSDDAAEVPVPTPSEPSTEPTEQPGFSGRVIGFGGEND